MKRTLGQRLGKCIRRLRLEKGMSQVEFGEKTGFYQTYISRLERGQANPTLNAIEVLATSLGLNVFELFDQLRADTES